MTEDKFNRLPNKEYYLDYEHCKKCNKVIHKQIIITTNTKECDNIIDYITSFISDVWNTSLDDDSILTNDIIKNPEAIIIDDENVTSYEKQAIIAAIEDYNSEKHNFKYTYNTKFIITNNFYRNNFSFGILCEDCYNILNIQNTNDVKYLVTS